MSTVYSGWIVSKFDMQSNKVRIDNNLLNANALNNNVRIQAK